MAEMATELMTTKLVDIKHEFTKVNPVMVSAIVQPIVENDLRVLLPQIMMRHKPNMWNMLPQNIKDLVISKSLDQSKVACKEMMEEIQTCIDELMDIKKIVTDHFGQSAAKKKLCPFSQTPCISYFLSSSSHHPPNISICSQRQNATQRDIHPVRLPGTGVYSQQRCHPRLSLRLRSDDNMGLLASRGRGAPSADHPR